MIRNLSSEKRWPRVGHIRLGIKAQLESNPEVSRPKEIDYFILDPHSGDACRDMELKEQFFRLYGEMPKSIKIMFPKVPRLNSIEEEIDLFFPQHYKRYGLKSSLKCIGNGTDAAVTDEEYAQGLRILGIDKASRRTKVLCQGPDCPFQKSLECKRSANLYCILPDLDTIGVFQINTSSYISIVNINSAVKYLNDIAGRYWFIPLNLSRSMVKTSYKDPKTGKRTNSEHYPLFVDCKVSLTDIGKASTLLTGGVPQLEHKPENMAIDASWQEVISAESTSSSSKSHAGPLLSKEHLSVIAGIAGEKGWTKKDVEGYCKEIFLADSIDILSDSHFQPLYSYIRDNPIKRKQK